MSSLSFFTFVLIALSCYALSSSQPTPPEYQAKRSVNLPNALNLENYTPEHQIAHATAVGAKDEARQKRSEYEWNTLEGKDISEKRETDKIFAKLSPERYQQIIDFLLRPSTPRPGPHTKRSSANYDNYFHDLSPERYQQVIDFLLRLGTARSGRSIDTQLLGYLMDGGMQGASAETNALDNVMDMSSMPWQLAQRVIKKSVPYKPRLGKRTQVCD